jgi:hypothetical protein
MSQISKIIAVSTMVFVAVSSSLAGTDDVSSELARKTVYWLYEDLYPTAFDEGYRIQISEPKVYYNIQGTVKYYAFFVYDGPGDIPSWDELMKLSDEVEPGPIPGLYNIVINGNRKLPPYFRFDSGIPHVIANKGKIREKLEMGEPRGNWRYGGAYIEGIEVYYKFRSGDTVVITDMSGRIINPSDVGFNLDLLDETTVKKNRGKWDEIEAFVETPSYWNNSLLKSSDFDLDSQDSPPYGNYIPVNWYLYMPEYSNIYGCAPAGTADYLASHGVKVEAYDSARAVARYNELAARGERVAAALHLTC